MLLERLCTYAERRLALPPPGYKPQNIRYAIDLDREGRFLGIIDTADANQRGVRQGKEFVAPYLKRSGSKPKPVPFADTAGRSLGLTYGDKSESWCSARHQEYVEIVSDCANGTGNSLVRAVATFLAGLDAKSIELPVDFERGALLTFRVENVLLFHEEAVRTYWAQTSGASGDGPVHTCVACGNERPVLRVHPLKVRGIHSGNSTGTDLISANKGAFWSYGLSNSLIAPTCYDCAWKYGNALNVLLEDPHTHLWVGSVDYIFWTAEETGFTPGKLLSDPDPSEVRALLDAARTGNAAATDVDSTAFYAVGLGGSGARIAVRVWIDTTVGEVKRRLANYFALQTIVEWDGKAGDPLPAWQLANATVRNQRKEAPAAAVTDGLFELALTGRRLPEGVLFRAIQRCRAGQGVTRERAALIKMALGSEQGWSEERIEAMSGLDATNRDPAYLCGRLLAVIDAIQQRAISANATVIDKFYGSASSAPASVFGNLLDNAQNHLSKLRKDPRTRSAGNALDARLMEVLDGLDAFPRTLTLPEQAMFALGYYHQRAADRRAARERAEERRQTGDTDEASDGQAQ